MILHESVVFIAANVALCCETKKDEEQATKVLSAPYTVKFSVCSTVVYMRLTCCKFYTCNCVLSVIS